MSLFSDFLHDYAPQSGWGTFFTAAFGAFAGAFGASRAQTKRAVVAELNAVSAAQTLCFSICNTFLALKSQHVVSMVGRFEKVHREHEAFHKAVEGAREGQGQFVFLADFQSLTPPTVPAAALEKIIFEKTSVRGRALVSLVSAVRRKLKRDFDVSNSIDQRDSRPDNEDGSGGSGTVLRHQKC